MKRYIIIVMICLITVFKSTIAISEVRTKNDSPWGKYAINLGAFITNSDTNLRFGSGVGISLDMDKILDFDTTNTAFRVDGTWRFTKNRRHRLDLSWYAFRKSGTKQVNIDIGEDIQAGQVLDGFVNLDIIQLGYSYSFIQDDRIDLAARGGLYVMPIKFGLKADGIFVGEGDVRFTAPLPVIGLRMDIAVAPKWFVRTGSQLFYLEYEQFKGSIVSLHGAIEYQPWKHFGLGLGLDSFSLEVEADGEDYPEIDFSGYVQFKYIGLQLYAKFVF